MHADREKYESNGEKIVLAKKSSYDSCKLR